jgi:hypothetical protein
MITRTRFDGDPAWKWEAPNGATFYLTQTRSRKWVWWRSAADVVSSEPFDSREALVAYLEKAFGPMERE